MQYAFDPGSLLFELETKLMAFEIHHPCAGDVGQFGVGLRVSNRRGGNDDGGDADRFPHGSAPSMNGVPQRVHQLGRVEVNGECEPSGEGGCGKSGGFQGHGGEA
jgi:hypothetical protein